MSKIIPDINAVVMPILFLSSSKNIAKEIKIKIRFKHVPKNLKYEKKVSSKMTKK
ncbi:hypothetical protein J7J23_02255 [bacterium]|nr:hypothetical protein [bacterium]